MLARYFFIHSDSFRAARLAFPEPQSLFRSCYTGEIGLRVLDISFVTSFMFWSSMERAVGIHFAR